MQDKYSWSAPIRELLACHEMFRALGFAPEHLFVEFFTPPSLAFLMNNGTHQFRITISMENRSVEEIRAEWSLATEWWNKLPSEEGRIKIFRESLAFKNKVGIVTALAQKGIPFYANPAPPPKSPATRLDNN